MEEVEGQCESCGEARMVLDAIHGVLACDACGRVGNRTETELRSEWQTGHVIERRGTFVGETDTGVAAAKSLMRGQISYGFDTSYPRWSERHRMETMKKVESITALLRVPSDKVGQVKHLLESTLDGDWGTGRWVDILVASCVYIVIRQSQLPLTIPEVADCVNCDVIELGRMFNRVLHKLEINLPNVDASVFLERAASTLPSLTKLDKEMVRKMTRQGTMLLSCAEEWYICTGRRPLPIVAAVLLLVVEANKVVVEFAEVARELHAGLWATKKRYKECLEALVGVGQRLPWGKDITIKTVPRHLPFLLQYLETKMKAKLKRNKKERESASSLLCSTVERVPSSDPKSSDCQQKPSITPQISVASSNSNLTNLGGNHRHTVSSMQALGSVLSDGSESEMPLKNVDGTTQHPRISSKDDRKANPASGDLLIPVVEERPAKLLKIVGEYSVSKQRPGSRSNEDISNGVNISFVTDKQHPVESISRSTELRPTTQDSIAERGLLTASDQKQLKWEGLPAAFCASVEARSRRQVKVNLAKNRIFEARKELKTRFAMTSSALGHSCPVQSVQEPLGPDGELINDVKTVNLDWEDLIIEHLVLCGAGEAELENGYYPALLAIYPMQSDSDLIDEASYLRSRIEVEFLEQLAPR